MIEHFNYVAPANDIMIKMPDRSPFLWGRARTQSPANTNYAPELTTFGLIARVSIAEVQWRSLALEEPPY